jgi:oligopeptide/dipeptide ABC transporter ATP-binding protein
VAEVIRVHQGKDRKQARLIALELLEQMGLPETERRYRQYPFELSGGMRQRVMIAAALSCRPKLLIADEPTTALDVTLQAQILELIRQRRSRDGMALLLITHDLAVARENVEKLLVLYAGGAVEKGEAARVLEAPRHPYTMGLLQSLPPWSGRMHRLLAIEGVVPHPADSVPGCRFHPRCAFAGERCRREVPEWVGVSGRVSACHFADQLSAPEGRR